MQFSSRSWHWQTLLLLLVQVRLSPTWVNKPWMISWVELLRLLVRFCAILSYSRSFMHNSIQASTKVAHRKPTHAIGWPGSLIARSSFIWTYPEPMTPRPVSPEFFCFSVANLIVSQGTTQMPPKPPWLVLLARKFFFLHVPLMHLTNLLQTPRRKWISLPGKIGAPVSQRRNSRLWLSLCIQPRQWYPWILSLSVAAYCPLN